jgi:hypothetical protein
MCYNRGPLLGVRHFEEFMVPRYRKVVNVLEEYGVKIHFLDCDGDISALAPGWLKAGVNGMFPNEARFTDSYELRERTAMTSSWRAASTRWLSSTGRRP